MAITKNDLSPGEFGFGVNGISADLSGCEILKAAPGVGYSIYLTQILISCVSAISVTVGQNENAGAVHTVLLGPFYFLTTSGSPISLKFRKKGFELSENTALTIDSSGAGNVQVFVEGYVE